MSTGKKLAQTAQMLAERPFHGRTEDQPSNLLPIVRNRQSGCDAQRLSITAVFRRDFPSRTVRRSAAAVVWQGAADGRSLRKGTKGLHTMTDSRQSVMQILSGRKGTSCCMTGCLSTESTTILVFC